MRKWSWLPVSAVVTGLVVVACVGDDASLFAADCKPNEKSCDGKCVANDDPLVGCAATACNPCVANVNSIAVCKANVCASDCATGFSDCDSNPQNGCEAKTGTDIANCGACGAVCGARNADLPPTCNEGKCTFTCKKDFAHCGGPDVGGCETALQTDALNCGACGHSCLGGTCEGGKCKPVQIASASFPTGLALDATNIYFSSPSESYVQRIGRDGKCTPAAPCPQEYIGLSDNLADYRGPSSIVSDGNFVWLIGKAISSISRRAVTGGAFVKWGPASDKDPGALVLAGGKLWWTSDFAGAGTVHVRKSDLDGANILTIANYNTPVANFQDDSAITADASFVYWTSKHSGVYRTPLTNATACNEDSTCTEIGGPGGVGIAVDDNFVYVAEPDGGAIRKMPKAGGASTLVASGQVGARTVVAIGTYVYWGVDGAIRRAPQVAAPCDAAACELVAPATSPAALIVGSDGLYWTDRAASGGVYRWVP